MEKRFYIKAVGSVFQIAAPKSIMWFVRLVYTPVFIVFFVMDEPPPQCGGVQIWQSRDIICFIMPEKF